MGILDEALIKIKADNTCSEIKKEIVQVFGNITDTYEGIIEDVGLALQDDFVVAEKFGEIEDIDNPSGGKITKEAIENVLTGYIFSHSHFTSAMDVSVSNENIPFSNADGALEKIFLDMATVQSSVNNINSTLDNINSIVTEINGVI